MYRTYISLLNVCATCLALFFLSSLNIIAETLSGRVVDEEGNPVAELTVALRELIGEDTEFAITDNIGNFSLPTSNSSVVLMLYPKTKVGYSIRRVSIEGMIHYPEQTHYGTKGIQFTILEGAEIKNVEIIVRKRLPLKGQVLNHDGTPLKNVRVMLRFSGRAINRSATTSIATETDLDNDGYFMEYVDDPGYYEVSVRYEKMFAISEEMLLTKEKENQKFVLMLGGKTHVNIDGIKVEPPPLKQQKDNVVPHQNPDTTPKSMFSGRVVDTDGNPITGFKIGLQPMQFINRMAVPEAAWMNTSIVPDSYIPRSLLLSAVNPSGTFSFTNIKAGPQQLVILPEDTTIDTANIPNKSQHKSHLESEYEIQSIKTGQLIYSDILGYPLFSLIQFTFAINPGATIENVEITVKQRSLIRGKIVYADGSPVKEKSIKLRMKEPQNREKGPIRLGDADGYTSEVNIHTDTYGDFSVYVENPGDYFFHVKHILLSAEAGPITIEDNTQQNELILKFNGTLIFPDTPTDDKKVNQQGFSEDEQFPDVWVMNPENGHTYKLITCEDWYDAHQQATKNGAHLVSINDEAEHKWIMEMFGKGFIWIGLNDLKKEGEWEWDSGEPLTYKIWETNKLYADETLSDEEKDYVLMSLNGAWEATAPNSTLWIMTRQAIIENDGRLSTIPPKNVLESR